jgi:hypothetical protein
MDLLIHTKAPPINAMDLVVVDVDPQVIALAAHNIGI